MKKIILMVSFMAIAISILAIPFFVGATALTVGNDTNERSRVDTYHNFVIIDTNHPATELGKLTSFSYYASNTNIFRFILVDSTDKVLWTSVEITPSGVGIQTFIPVKPVTVHPGDNLGLYFKSTGTIPFEYTGASAWYMSNNSDLPAVDSILSYAGSSGRIYSFVAVGVVDKGLCKNGGWKSFTNPSFKNQGQCVSYINGRADNHGQYVKSQGDKKEAAQSRVGMPVQSKGHKNNK